MAGTSPAGDIPAGEAGREGQGGLSGCHMDNTLKRLAREMARSCGAGAAGRAAPGASPGGKGHLLGIR